MLGLNGAEIKSRLGDPVTATQDKSWIIPIWKSNESKDSTDLWQTGDSVAIRWQHRGDFIKEGLFTTKTSTIWRFKKYRSY